MRRVSQPVTLRISEGHSLTYTSFTEYFEQFSLKSQTGIAADQRQYEASNTSFLVTLSTFILN
jgi:hypothetical protein